MEIKQAIDRLLQEIESLGAAERNLSTTKTEFSRLWDRIWSQHRGILQDYYGRGITVNNVTLYWNGVIYEANTTVASRAEALLNLLQGLPQALQEVTEKLSHHKEIALKATAVLQNINEVLEPEAAVSVLQQGGGANND